MFGDLYDAISLLWAWCWPVAHGQITAVDIERIRRDHTYEARLAVAYEFSVGDDGPYTGESFWKPMFFSVKRVAAARRRIRIRGRVTVRFRPDDPSVNTIDGGVKALLKSQGKSSDSTHPDSQGRLSSLK